MNNLKVAICIPAYEKCELLERLLESIDKQTYSNRIIIITDNSRTDNVKNLVQHRDKKNIIYVHNDRQLGASGNANKSIKLALNNKVDLIKIMFQDDWFTEDYSLEKMVKILNDEDVDVIFSSNLDVYNKRIALHECPRPFFEKIKEDPSVLFRANQLGAPSNILYRVENTMFDSNYTWLLDVDFYLRILKGKKCGYIYEPLISIGHDGDQLTDYYSQNPLKVLREVFDLYKKYDWVHTLSNRIYLITKTKECCLNFVKKKIKHTWKLIRS